MVTSINDYQTVCDPVFHTLSLVLAAAVCDQIEKAGFPAHQKKFMGGFSIFVNPEFKTEVDQLLKKKTNIGEVFSYQGDH